MLNILFNFQAVCTDIVVKC